MKWTTFSSRRAMFFLLIAPIAGLLHGENKNVHVKLTPDKGYFVDERGQRAGFDGTGEVGFQEIPGSTVDVWTHSENHRSFIEITVPSPQGKEYRLVIPPTPKVEPDLLPYDASGEITVYRLGYKTPDSWSVELIRPQDVAASVRVNLPELLGRGLSLSWDGAWASKQIGKPMVGIKVTGSYYLNVSDRGIRRLGWGKTFIRSRGQIYGPLRDLSGGYWCSVENRMTGNGTPREKVQWVILPFVTGVEYAIGLLGQGSGTIAVSAWTPTWERNWAEINIPNENRDKGFTLKCLSAETIETELRRLY